MKFVDTHNYYYFLRLSPQQKEKKNLKLYTQRKEKKEKKTKLPNIYFSILIRKYRYYVYDIFSPKEN